MIAPETAYPTHPLAHLPGARRLSQLVETWHYRLLGKRRYNRLTLERVGDLSLLVLPQVFNPALLHSGVLLADCLMAHAPSAGQRVLDLGCGSGVGAVFAARRGAQVIASDINPHAVRCTHLNAVIHSLEPFIEVRRGDLFAAVAAERFDLLMFNPPYYRGKPVTWLDHAWRGEDVIERFAAEARNFLLPGGRVWLVLSREYDGERILRICAAHGWRFRPLLWQHRIHESLGVWEASR